MSDYPYITKQIIQLDFGSYVAKSTELLTDALAYLKEHPNLDIVGIQFSCDESGVLTLFCEEKE